MNQGLRTFLERIVDYAGLFPPAQLEMDSAFAKFADHARGPHAWMLGRFVCPAGRFGSFVSALEAGQRRNEPVRVSAIARPLGSVFEIGTQLHEDLVAMHELHARSGGRAVVECVELRLPTQAGANLEAARETIDAIALQIVETGTRASGEDRLLETYVELGGSMQRSAVEAVAGALSGRPGFGFKLRCGGPSAESIPSPATVAHVLAECRERGVALKATAGLHHPIRHHDAALGASMHGFFNLFGAGVLGYAHSLTEEELLPILEDERASNFVFEESGFRWRDIPIDLQTLQRVRARFVTSFGSCSFDEPIADLQSLGLL